MIVKELVDQAVEVICKNHCIISIKLMGIDVLNAVSIYGSQIGLIHDIKRQSREDLDEFSHSISQIQQTFHRR